MLFRSVQASLLDKYHITFSSIARDSRLLEGYSRRRDAIWALEFALKELETTGTIAKWTKSIAHGARRTIEDITYTLVPSRTFIADQKSANKRQKDAREAIGVESLG